MSPNINTIIIIILSRSLSAYLEKLKFLLSLCGRRCTPGIPGGRSTDDGGCRSRGAVAASNSPPECSYK